MLKYQSQQSLIARVENHKLSFSLMSELVSLHVGQAGCQIGEAYWDRISREHGLHPSFDGKGSDNEKGSVNVMFQESRKGYTPRCLFADLDPGMIDEVRKGQLGELLGPKRVISGKEDAAGTWSRGTYTAGRQIRDQTVDQIRKIVELCDNFAGFIVTHSISGGTGGGFTQLLSHSLQDYRKKNSIYFSVFPSPNMASEVVEPYNSVMTIDRLFSRATAVVPFDNQKLYSICSEKLSVDQPNFKNINSLIAKVICSFTAPLRYNKSTNCSLDSIITNLIPYHKIKYLLPSYGPFESEESGYSSKLSLNDLTSTCLSSEGVMMSCSPQRHRSMASWVNYIGDVTPVQAIKAVGQIREEARLRLVPWSPTGFKVTQTNSISNTDFIIHGNAKKSCCTLTNSTALMTTLDRMTRKFDSMFATRSFVHWYCQEGLEFHELPDSRQYVAGLERDYQQIERQAGDVEAADQ